MPTEGTPQAETAETASLARPLQSRHAAGSSFSQDDDRIGRGSHGCRLGVGRHAAGLSQQPRRPAESAQRIPSTLARLHQGVRRQGRRGCRGRVGDARAGAGRDEGRGRRLGASAGAVLRGDARIRPHAASQQRSALPDAGATGRHRRFPGSRRADFAGRLELA